MLDGRGAWWRSGRTNEHTYTVLDGRGAWWRSGRINATQRIVILSNAAHRPGHTPCWMDAAHGGGAVGRTSSAG